MPPPAALRGWLSRPVLAAAAFSVASGYAQFGVVAALGDVAAAFGDPSADDVLGLSGTTLGAGLAVIRLAALAGLPLAALADRLGRKVVLLACATAGLALTGAGALSPAYWSFIALFALARPLLSATNAVVGVIAAEETGSRDRAAAVALITAGYGVGAGVTALVRAVGGEALGFRGLFALALVPLLALPFLARALEEPPRFRRAAARSRLGLGAVHADLRPRLAILFALALAGSFASSPINAYVFAYAEQVLGLTRAATALIVPLAAVVGFLGLVSGRWAADRVGRRRTALSMHLLVALAGVVTYAAAPVPAIAGYLLGLFAGSAYAPAVGALTAEVFPTSERATAAGWLTAASALGAVTGLFTFGWLLDASDSFTSSALLVVLPIAVTAPAYLRLPETRGLELEESAPEQAAASAGTVEAGP